MLQLISTKLTLTFWNDWKCATKIAVRQEWKVSRQVKTEGRTLRSFLLL